MTFDLRSLGTTEITLTATQAEDTATNGPQQVLDVKFNLTVE